MTALTAAQGFDPPEHPDASCPVCFEDFSSVLPTPDELSRSPPGRWACGNANPLLNHAVCRGCDADLQSRLRPAQRRCPICRSARVCFMVHARLKMCAKMHAHCNVVTETAVTDDCLYAMHAYCATREYTYSRASWVAHTVLLTALLLRVKRPA